MDAQKIESADIAELVQKLILADRVMQRQGVIWGERYEEMSKPIRAARKALDEALEANAQTLARKEAALVRLRGALEWYAAIGTAISPDGLVTIADAGKVARIALTQQPKEPT